MKRTTKPDETLRTRVALLLMLGGMGLLGLGLWRMQVLGSSEYDSSLRSQSIRRVRVPAMRGHIQDRFGRVLADNRPSYCLALYIEELRRPGAWDRTIDRVESVIQRLGGILGEPSDVTRRDIRNHIMRRRPLPLLAWRDLGPEALARWAENAGTMPGVDIYVEPVRVYPHGATACHTLGYVGRADPDPETQGTFNYYLPQMVGRDGIERVLDASLAGEAGGRLLRVDVSGFRREVLRDEVREPKPGRDVQLTLDIEIQKAVESLLGGWRGAAVVMDPRNGDLLALASTPSFDLNMFQATNVVRWMRECNRDPQQPFFNRALAGAYPPGSTFKPLIAVAALEGEKLTAQTCFSCDGAFELGRLSFGCWSRAGHGTIALRKAIEQSCNSYFCQAGLRCGFKRIQHVAEAAGFGEPTGLLLRGESAGYLPYHAWPGDVCNISIGQGAVLATPVQMAAFISALANGGRLYRPRLVLDGQPPALRRQLPWSADTLALVRGGMYDVVQAPNGTGKRARIEACEMAGKTGTAEYGPRTNRRKHAWMVVFAPFAEPRYVAVMVLEDAVSGGVSVAPRMKLLMERVFELERLRAHVPALGGLS